MTIMFKILIILLVLRLVLGKVDPMHWSRITISLAADICIFIVFGWFVGIIWIIFRAWLLYRAYKLQKKGETKCSC